MVITVAKPTTASEAIHLNSAQFSCDSTGLVCRLSVNHHVKAKTHEKGTNVSLANAPTTPHIGSRYHLLVSRPHVTAAIKQASPASISPASWRLEIAKLSK